MRDQSITLNPLGKERPVISLHFPEYRPLGLHICHLLPQKILGILGFPRYSLVSQSQGETPGLDRVHLILGEESHNTAVYPGILRMLPSCPLPVLYILYTCTTCSLCVRNTEYPGILGILPSPITMQLTSGATLSQAYLVKRIARFSCMTLYIYPTL